MIGTRVTESDEGDCSADAVSIDGLCDASSPVLNGKVACPVEGEACVTGCIVCGACGTMSGEGVCAAMTSAVEEYGDTSIGIVCGHGKCMLSDDHLCKGCGT